MLNLPTWHTGASGLHYRMGGVLAFVVTIAAVRIVWVWSRRRPSLHDDLRVLLIGSSLKFIVMTAIGRVSLGAMLTEWPGTVGLPDGPLRVMKGYGTSKAAWADVYLATGSLETAQAAVLQPIYPKPDERRFNDKLRILHERTLSFFAGGAGRHDYLPWLAEVFRLSGFPLPSSPVSLTLGDALED
jgi:hypothetical protein